MLVLGIETSCDETSAAVVKDGRKVLSNEVASSLKFHQKYGGVVPEIAFRMHLETIAEVCEAALKDAGIRREALDLISVTSSPGLLGSLLTGISFAKSVSYALGIPLVGVNHIHSHFYANFLDGKKIRFPFVALVVSGGHTSLFYVNDFLHIELLGQTQDDACGEAFDKVAKILGLGYPGGPLIEKQAREGNEQKIRFACSGTQKALNFSFSGIKTAVLYYVRDAARGRLPVSDIAASFQKAAIDVLVKKSLLACAKKNTPRLAIGGGVVANRVLREKFLEAAKKENVQCYFPLKELCTDNAAMVAGLGYQLFKKGVRSDLTLTPELN